MKQSSNWNIFFFILLSLLFFLLIGYQASIGAFDRFNLTATQAIQQFNHPAIIGFMQAVSILEFLAPIIVLVLPVIFYLKKMTAEILFLLLTIGLSVTPKILKEIYQLSCPAEPLVHKCQVFHLPYKGPLQLLKTNFCYPSGHVFNYVLFGGFLLFLTLRFVKNSSLKFIISILLSSIIAMIGPSRIYLGAHWAGDVVGGYLLGFSYLLAVILIYDQREIIARRLKAQSAKIKAKFKA